MFTSPVPPAGLWVCWAVTRSANNALAAPSNFNHVDTSPGVAMSCWHRCCHWTDVSELCRGGSTANVDYAPEVKQMSCADVHLSVRASASCPCMQMLDTCLHTWSHVHALKLFFFWPFMCSNCEVSGAARPCSESLDRSVWFTSLVWALLPSSCIMSPLETADTVALFIIQPQPAAHLGREGRRQEQEIEEGKEK